MLPDFSHLNPISAQWENARQIGFPGGRADPEDKGPAETALRELHEELGVPSSHVQLHGMVPHTFALDRAPVLALVGSTKFPAQNFQPSKWEVAEVILVPWVQLTRDCSKKFQFNLFGKWRASHLFLIDGQRIWGISAQLIYSADFRRPG